MPDPDPLTTRLDKAAESFRKARIDDLQKTIDRLREEAARDDIFKARSAEQRWTLDAQIRSAENAYAAFLRDEEGAK